MKVKFRHYDCAVKIGQYGNGRLAIQLMHAEDGDPVATLTINLVEDFLPPNHIFVKDWSENSGVVEFMQKENIIAEVIDRVPSGYVMVPMCRLADEFIEKIESGYFG